MPKAKSRLERWKETGVTFSHAARKAGVRHSTISRAVRSETAKPGSKVARVVATILGTDPTVEFPHLASGKPRAARRAA